MDAQSTLVIFLATALAIFLVLAIVFVAYLISIAQQVRRIIDSAERTATTVEVITSNIQKAVAPAVAAQFVFDQFKRVVDVFSDKDKKRARSKEDEKEV
jgi:hypothetical protein